MPESPVSSSSPLVDVVSKASGEESDPIAKKTIPASLLSRSSTMDDVVPGSSGEESDPDAEKTMPASPASSSSPLLDVVSKASGEESDLPSRSCTFSGFSKRKWDPTYHWTNWLIHDYWLAAGPQEDYSFPEYLGYADSGPYRLGAIFSRPNDMDSLIFAPEAVPHEHAVSTGLKTFHDEKLRYNPFSRSTRKRKFRIQQIAKHWARLGGDQLNRMIGPYVNNLEPCRRRRIYVMTGLKIADGLEVRDGEFYRKFDGRVIFSYQIYEVKITWDGSTLELINAELWDPHPSSRTTDRTFLTIF